MFPVPRITLAIACLAATIVPAEACAVFRPPPDKQQAAAAQFPRLGFVGRVKATFEAPETKQSGESIVWIEVTQDFSNKLPPLIYVLNPGCCLCVSIGGARGDEVISIVRRGDDGLFHLDY
jgi:hypothetical protein